MIFRSNSNTTAKVGTVRKNETIGAKKARTGEKQRAITANVTPNKKETANAKIVRSSDAPNATQNALPPNKRPIDANVSQNDGRR